MFAVLTFMIIDGIAYGVNASQIPKLIPEDVDEDMVFRLVGFTFISFGVGAAIGGFTCGFISDKLGSFNSGRLTLALWVLSCSCFIAAV